ncbi:Uncharacterised protein [uncultured Bacteroides sp.]|uniref:fimbrillin family protein n=1 Tax=Bacteroides cellulolyticus TaxID=2981780 RepID=UPI0008233B96|nr:fimbrillin family protein [Bacteroides cellulolyticus]MCU6772370.1 fimbrillin family protein [Bacteroides cellulolyticus]SCI35308.1 Uncharacterised protein [uncultured Bacteroides sp.]
MKKVFYSLIALTLMITAAGCQDDTVTSTIDNPAQTGDEISFGMSLPQNGIETRTAYGTPIDTDNDQKLDAFPVYWENGDEIAIYCPQASMPASKLVNYTIGVSNSTSSTAETVTKIGDAGLQWGSEDLHKFYGFYPVKFVKGTESTGLFDLTLPVEQRPLRFEQDAEGNYTAVSNPEFAIMYAYRGQKKSKTPVGTDIDLQFKPLSTILEIEVSAPGNITEPITLTNINVEADGTSIVGDFTAQVYPGSDTEESYESTVVCKTNMSGVVTDNISVPCSWINEQGVLEYVKLAAGKKLVVRAFLIPNENEIDGSNIKITVATSGGTVHKTLTTSDNSFKILPHKVSRVTLPTLPTQYNVNYWMSSLDPDIYLTELSIPGSKFTNTSSYQPTGTEQQYKDGVRAFILHTQASRNWVVDGFFEGHWDYSVSVNNAGTLKESFKQIAQYLENAETAFAKEGKVSNEFALVMVTYKKDGLLESIQQEIWINGIQEEISEMADDPSYRIYDSEVTPETTIEDVRGRIIVKANVNSDHMVTTGATAPILYSLWEGPYGPETSKGSGINYQDKFGGMPLYWQNYQAYDGNSAGNSKLRWYYQEVTTTSDSGSDAEATFQSKVDAITNQFSMGVDLYRKESHDTWLMNDIGGEKTDVSSGTTSHNRGNYSDGIQYSNGIEYTAAELNQLCLNELLKREENAGMGLIFMNFANRGEKGKKFQSDLILQTIIDNNFKFALRKKTTSGGGEGTKSYNASYSNGGNAVGWDE